MPVEGPHPEDRFLTETVEQQGARFGIAGESFEPDRWLAENDVVTVGAQSFKDQIYFYVEDDGPGVPPELAPTLFERFVRGAGDRGGSFGLGLAIVRGIARAHGGEAGVGNRPGLGATFWIRIPR